MVIDFCFFFSMKFLLANRRASSQAKGTKSTSFLTHVWNEVDLVPLACEDDRWDAALLFAYEDCLPMSHKKG